MTVSGRRNYSSVSVSVDSPFGHGKGIDHLTTHASMVKGGRNRPIDLSKEDWGRSPGFARDPRINSDDEKDNLSSASTPVKSTKSGFANMLRWHATDEVFQVSEGVKLRQLDFRTVLPVLEERLFFQAVGFEPRQQPGVHYFTMDKVMKYAPFCADFGPFNLGMTHHFCEVMRELLVNPRLAHTKLILYTSTAQSDVTNAIYLLGAFLCLHLGATPQEAWAPFSKIQSCPCIPYRDATWVPSTFDLHVTDCWAGVIKGLKTGLYNPIDFDKDEYFYYDHPTNGDMHEVVKNKFFAFKGPTGKRKPVGYGRYTLLPTDYCDVFRSKGIRTVIRLNNKEYDRATLVQQGFHHHDLFFTDCSTPSDAIVDKFLRIAETSEGAIAVHCLAGLGRTGTLIAMYMMKHMDFSATEAMAWLRVCRPGSVIGPQQMYLKQQESRMRALGLKGVAGLGLDGARSNGNHDVNDAKAQELADMVSKGMADRDCARVGSGGEDKLKDAVTPSRVVNGRRAGSQGKVHGGSGGLPVPAARPGQEISLNSSAGNVNPTVPFHSGSEGSRQRARRPMLRERHNSESKLIGDRNADNLKAVARGAGGGGGYGVGRTQAVYGAPPVGAGASAARLLRNGGSMSRLK